MMQATLRSLAILTCLALFLLLPAHIALKPLVVCVAGCLLRRRQMVAKADSAAAKPEDVQPLHYVCVPRQCKWYEYEGSEQSRNLKSLKEQLCRRPDVWHVGLWEDEEAESVAERCAELLGDFAGLPRLRLVPGDRIQMIELVLLDGELFDLDDIDEGEEE